MLICVFHKWVCAKIMREVMHHGEASQSSHDALPFRHRIAIPVAVADGLDTYYSYWVDDEEGGFFRRRPTISG